MAITKRKKYLSLINNERLKHKKKIIKSFAGKHLETKYIIRERLVKQKEERMEN